MALLPKKPNRGAWKKGQSGNPRGTAGHKISEGKARSRIARERVVATLAASKNLMPLDFMLEVLRNPNEYPFHARAWAAEKAAPYTHRKMPIAVEGGDAPIKFIDLSRLGGMSEVELNRLLSNLDSVLGGLGVLSGENL